MTHNKDIHPIHREEPCIGCGAITAMKLLIRNGNKDTEVCCMCEKCMRNLIYVDGNSGEVN